MSTKKKSLVPLFGVAFIVAIVSTGIFYGLFVGKLNSASVPGTATGKIFVALKSLPVGTVLKAEQLKEVAWSAPSLPAGAIAKIEEAIGQTLVEPVSENEILTHSRIASKNGGAVEGGSMGIPDGMRAVSLQVQDSAGVVAMLKPGHRVDIQVVATVHGQFNNEPQLRTVLENMQILTLPKEPQYQRSNASIVTVLATPREAAALGLADSTAKIRITLRNPIDQKKDNIGTVGLGSFFRAGQAVQTSSSQPFTPRPPALPQQVQLLIRVTGADAAAIKEIDAQVDASASGESLHVAAFRASASVESILQRTQVIATSRVTSSPKGESGAQWRIEDPSKSWGLRIQFAPSILSSGKVRVRVYPEVTTSAESGLSHRRVDTEVEVADGQSFLVRGLASLDKIATLREKLFPASVPATTAQELLVVITPKVIRPAAAVPPPTD